MPQFIGRQVRSTVAKLSFAYIVLGATAHDTGAGQSAVAGARATPEIVGSHTVAAVAVTAGLEAPIETMYDC